MPTVICHFLDEEVLLPYWLRHHRRLFDHGIMIDYGSVDRSAALIREYCPDWEIVPTRNRYFDAAPIDFEVMELESRVPGWKMVLNVTEFILHPDLRGYVAERERRFPELPGVQAHGLALVDHETEEARPLTEADLFLQRHWGFPAPAFRNRLLHRAETGQYLPGRHQTRLPVHSDEELVLLWFGYCPMALAFDRRRRHQQRWPAYNPEKPHRPDEELQLEARWHRTCAFDLREHPPYRLALSRTCSAFGLTPQFDFP